MHLISEGSACYLIEVEDPSLQDLLNAGMPEGAAERALDELQGKAPPSLIADGFGPSELED